ncbi:Class V chitinase [Linum perenne]
MAISKLLIPFFSAAAVFLLLLHSAAAQPAVVRGGYWFPDSGFAVSAIESRHFTHLFCAFAGIDSGNFQLTVPAANRQQFMTFTQTVQSKNPSVRTLLSIGGGGANVATFAAMASQPGRRKSFIDTSISTAVSAEARTSGKPPLLLSAAVLYLPYYYSNAVPYPVRTISNSLDWINLMAYDFFGPGWTPTTTGPPAALFNPGRRESGDNAINLWIQAGLGAKKIVLGMPFYGWSWQLNDAGNHGLYSPANGKALQGEGSATYSQINAFIRQNRATKVYNSTVVSDYCYSGRTWIGYDDVQSVSTKVAYAKRRGLLGYFAWHVGADDNWTLSSRGSQTFLFFFVRFIPYLLRVNRYRRHM